MYKILSTLIFLCVSFILSYRDMNQKIYTILLACELTRVHACLYAFVYIFTQCFCVYVYVPVYVHVQLCMMYVYMCMCMSYVCICACCVQLNYTSVCMCFGVLFETNERICTAQQEHFVGECLENLLFSNIWQKTIW